MLGFTRHEFSTGHKQKLRTINITIGTIISITAVILIAMFDSYFLQRTKSYISPLQRNDVHSCAMSYSYPTYLAIDVESRFSTKYKLKLFRDGYRDNSDRFYGRPALFIPGQAGSYGQVRSLASTTTNMFHDDPNHGHNIDFFTVDLNEELSALNGQNLLDQAEFLNTAIDHIISMYSYTKPTSVMIIGHSMGGIVARAMPMLSNYKKDSINTIVTIATPHLSAPLLLDSITFKIYKGISRYWNEHQSTLLKDMTLISIAGGSLDNIIHSDSVNIESFIPRSHGFTTFTTSIPNVWTGSDHMAILWCNQFIRTLANTLLEIVDNSSVEERMKIFNYYLLEGGSASLLQHQNTISDISLLRKKQILPLNESFFQLLFSEETESSIKMVHASTNLQILTNIHQHYDNRWSLLLCKGEHVENMKCDYVKPKVTLLPSATAETLVDSIPYRLLEISRKQKQNYDYIGIVNHGGYKIKDGDNAVFLKGHAISESPSKHTTTVWDIISKGKRITVDNYFSVHTFSNIRNSLFALNVHVSSIKETQPTLFKPMMQQSINGGELKYYRGLEKRVSDRITFHRDISVDNQGLSLQFYLDNQILDIDITIDWYATLGRSILRYGPIMSTFLWMITLVVLSSQAYSYIANGKRSFEKFHIALFNSLNKSILQLVAMLLLASIIQSYSLTWFKEYPLINDISKYILFGSDDWIMAGMVLFSFILTIGLTFVIWLLVAVIVYILSIPLSIFLKLQSSFDEDSNMSMAEILTVSIPILFGNKLSFVFPICFLLWLKMTASARVSAKSDLPRAQNIYNYRFSCLMFLVSLLPYTIPSLIADIKDLLIEGNRRGFDFSYIAIIQGMPNLLVVLYLTSKGKNPSRLEAKYLQPVIYILNATIVYQALFGFLHPFLLSVFL